MDQAPVNHIAHSQTGILYNSKKAIGGIRYYKVGEERKVNPPISHKDKNPRKKREVLVNVPNKKTRKDKQELTEVKKRIEFRRREELAEKPKAPRRTRRSLLSRAKFRLSLKRLRNKKGEGSLDRVSPENQNSEAIDKLISEETNTNKAPVKKRIKKQRRLIVKVSNQYVDFEAEGIKPSKLSRKDKDWIRKANYYFINVKERNRRIGSAEEYTSPEILHALWSTAELHDIDPKRFIVQMFNETRFNPNLRGRAGERGLGQFKKPTAEAHGCSWSKMTAGIKTYAYQAKCAASFVSKVGEATYNGGGSRSRKYVKKISKHIKGIDRTKIPKTSA